LFLMELMKKQTFLLLVVLGLILRFTAFWLMPSNLAEDAGNYHEIAVNLIKTGKYVGSEGLAYRPPLQPIFLAGIYKTLGVNPAIASIVQIVLSLLTAVMIGEISYEVRSISYELKKKKDNRYEIWDKEIKEGEKFRGIDWLAVGLALFSFDLALFSPLLMSETLFIFLTVLGFWFLLKDYSLFPASPAGGTIHYSLAFLCFGLSVLVKPMILPALLIVVFLILKKRFKQNYLLFIIYYLLFIAPSVLWSVRNTLIFKRPVFISTNSGWNFYVGNNIYSKGTYDKETEKGIELTKNMSELEKNNFYQREGLKFVKEHPDKALLNVIRKPFYLFAAFGGSAEGLIVRSYEKGNYSFKNLAKLFFGVGQILSYYLILFGAIYFFVSKNKHKKFIRHSLFMVHYSLFYILALLPFFTFPRFRIPLLPFMIIFASQGIRNFFQEKKKFNRRFLFSFFLFVILIIRDIWKIILFVQRY